MAPYRLVRLVIVVLLAVTACTSDAAIRSSVATTPSSTDLHDSEQLRLQALDLLATDIDAEPSCVVDQFRAVATPDLEVAGIRATGPDRAMWDRVIADATSPVLDPLMLTLSRCTEFFRQLVYEDLADLLQPEELDCIVRHGRGDPNIVVLHVAGTRDGATLEEAYPDAMVEKIQQGTAARSAVLAAMRAFGECPSLSY